MDKCDMCLHHKGKTVTTPGTLQPLLVPEKTRIDLSMDFIK